MICGHAKMPADKAGLWICPREQNHGGSCAAMPVPAIDAAVVNGVLVITIDAVARTTSWCRVKGDRGAWQVTTTCDHVVSLELLAKLAMVGLAALR